MLVSEVLRRKGDEVATVRPDATIAELLATLAEHNIGAVIVSDDGSTVTGIVSERDIVRALHAQGPAVLDLRVTEIMTADVSVAGPDDHAEQLMRLMTERRVRHVPIVVDGRLSGIVSIGDVVKNRIDELEAERASLIGYINSGG